MVCNYYYTVVYHSPRPSIYVHTSTNIMTMVYHHHYYNYYYYYANHNIN